MINVPIIRCTDVTIGFENLKMSEFENLFLIPAAPPLCALRL